VSDGQISPHEAEELAVCFRTHARDLFGYACMLTRGDQARAEDLVQATFEAAGQAWPVLEYLAEDRRRDWLQRTLANIAVDGFRRETALRDRLPRIEARSRKIQADPPGQAPHEEAPPGQAPHEEAPHEEAPHEEALSSIALERCWRIIQGLPERQHVVALLRWQLDMKESEIASVLGMDSKTVSAQLDRARRKLMVPFGPDLARDGDEPERAAP
jgi:RNA polymerase sigma factor (sigma-70 family)